MLLRFLVNAAAIAVATWWVPGITLREGPVENKVVALLAVAVIFGLVNSVLKPIFTLFSTPLILVTLGLFLLIINALLLLLTSWVAGQFGLGWHVDGLASAFWGALIVSVVSFILNAFVGNTRAVEHR